MNSQQLNEYYDKMFLDGQSLYNRGAVLPHPGISTDWKRRLALVATFDQTSLGEIWRYASSPTMESLLQRLVADRDFPAYTTILEAEDRNGAEIVPKKLPNQFAALEHMVAKCLFGEELVFSRMIDDGKGTIILASTRVPEFLKSARMVATAVNRLMPQLQVKPLEIVHITAARITDPRIKDEMSTMMEEVHRSAMRTDARLRNDPIIARINDVRLVQVHQFLTTGPTTVPRPPKS